jgi:ketosteroid isomerase-like protein
MYSNIQTVQAIYEAFGRGDIETIISKLHPRVQWEAWNGMTAQDAGVPWLQKRIGISEVPAFFQSLAGAQFHAFEPRSFMAGEGQVAVTLFFDATFEQTGRRINDEEIHWWSFDDRGQVIAFRHYCDTAKHMWAAGTGAVPNANMAKLHGVADRI